MKAFEYLAPKSLSDAVAVLAEKGERARILAGGTDILVQLREGRRPGTDRLVDVKHVPEVNDLTYRPAAGPWPGGRLVEPLPTPEPEVFPWRLPEHQSFPERAGGGRPGSPAAWPPGWLPAPAC